MPPHNLPGMPGLLRDQDGPPAPDPRAARTAADAHLSSGLGATQTRAERKAQGKARAFRYNPDMERLLAHPELLDSLPMSLAANQRLALGFYAGDKRAAQDAGLDVSGPEAT